MELSLSREVMYNREVSHASFSRSAVSVLFFAAKGSLQLSYERDMSLQDHFKRDAELATSISRKKLGCSFDVSSKQDNVGLRLDDQSK